MDILVASPCYEGKNYMQFTGSMVVEQEIAVRNGHRLVPAFLKGGALPTTSRNKLANEFLKTDLERMVWVDSDVSWNPGDLLKIALSPRPMVGALHMKRKGVNTDKGFEYIEEYPVYILPGKRGLAPDHCYQVAGMSFGFVAIARVVFEDMMEKFPERWHTAEGEKEPVFFHAPFADQNVWGEDIAFCFDYGLAGGEVWVDTSIIINHHDGPCTFTGSFWEWLKKQQKEKS